VVFTQTESRAVIAEMKGARRLIAGLLYGSGLRIMEAVRLRIKDLDFQREEDHCQRCQGRKAESHDAAASAEATASGPGRGRAETSSIRFEKRLW
jgi:integrase